MKQSPPIYARALVLFSRYESAKGMVYVSFIAAVGFLARGVHLWVNEYLIILALIGCLLCRLFFSLYKRLLRYYRNTVLYGFYEYAVTREKLRGSEDLENQPELLNII